VLRGKSRLNFKRKVCGMPIGNRCFPHYEEAEAVWDLQMHEESLRMKQGKQHGPMESSETLERLLDQSNFCGPFDEI
jgi:hypothetical protein